MNGSSRFPEIDLLRGIAILMMIIFMCSLTVRSSPSPQVVVDTGFWRYFAYATASLFLLIAGVSLTISHARSARHLAGWPLVQKFLLRGAGIFACGLLVTVATWWYLQEGFVIFGILHLIGVSIMLSPLFFRFRKWNAVIGLVFIIFGWFLATIPGPAALLVFGIHPLTFWSVDYTPVFPWMGLVLIGMAVGEFAYPGGERNWTMPRLPEYVVSPHFVPWPALARDLPGAPAGDPSYPVLRDRSTGPLTCAAWFHQSEKSHDPDRSDFCIFFPFLDRFLKNHGEKFLKMQQKC